MMQKRVQAPVNDGTGKSVIIWLTGLVFGVSAGLLLVYHFLLASRASPGVEIPVAEASQPGGAKLVRASARSVDSAHSAAARDALASEAN